MNRTRKLLGMNGTSESGSWAVSRSERNTQLSMSPPIDICGYEEAWRTGIAAGCRVFLP